MDSLGGGCRERGSDPGGVAGQVGEEEGLPVAGDSLGGGCRERGSDPGPVAGQVGEEEGLPGSGDAEPPGQHAEQHVPLALAPPPAWAGEQRAARVALPWDSVSAQSRSQRVGKGKHSVLNYYIYIF